MILFSKILIVVIIIHKSVKIFVILSPTRTLMTVLCGICIKFYALQNKVLQNNRLFKKQFLNHPWVQKKCELLAYKARHDFME